MPRRRLTRKERYPMGKDKPGIAFVSPYATTPTGKPKKAVRRPVAPSIGKPGIRFHKPIEPRMGAPVSPERGRPVRKPPAKPTATRRRLRRRR